MRYPETIRIRHLLGFLLTTAVFASVSACELPPRGSDLRELAAIPLTTQIPPWYVAHGVIVGGPALMLRDATSGAEVNAVDHLTRERHIKDRTGKLISSPYREDGLPRFPRTDGQFVGEGHPNQFLAMLTGSGVPLSQPVVLIDGATFTLSDILEHAKLHVRPSQIATVPPATAFENHELGWTIGLLADTVGTDANWKNTWDEDVSVEQLVAIAVQRPIGWGSCGGTHELFGLARALRARRAVHDDLSGVWEQLARYLDEAMARARAAQHPDGSFDYEWAQPREGKSPAELGLRAKTHITGHMLEWLVMAATPGDTEASYIGNADAFLDTCHFKDVALEPGRRDTDIVSYGALTHAVHAMMLYHQKLAPLAAPPSKRPG
jgi:hypothetical protein